MRFAFWERRLNLSTTTTKDREMADHGIDWGSPSSVEEIEGLLADYGVWAGVRKKRRELAERLSKEGFCPLHMRVLGYAAEHLQAARNVGALVGQWLANDGWLHFAEDFHRAAKKRQARTENRGGGDQGENVTLRRLERELNGAHERIAELHRQINWALGEYRGEHDAVETEIVEAGVDVPDVVVAMGKLASRLRTANETTKRRNERIAELEKQLAGCSSTK